MTRHCHHDECEEQNVTMLFSPDCMQVDCNAEVYVSEIDSWNAMQYESKISEVDRNAGEAKTVKNAEINELKTKMTLKCFHW